jgi:hypothetical protein
VISFTISIRFSSRRIPFSPSRIDARLLMAELIITFDHISPFMSFVSSALIPALSNILTISFAFLFSSDIAAISVVPFPLNCTLPGF